MLATKRNYVQTDAIRWMNFKSLVGKRSQKLKMTYSVPPVIYNVRAGKWCRNSRDHPGLEEAQGWGGGPGITNHHERMEVSLEYEGNV